MSSVTEDSGKKPAELSWKPSRELEQLADEHYLFGLHRARIFRRMLLIDLLGMFQQFEYDATNTELSFTTGERFRAQLLGTHAAASPSFLWAWGNHHSNLPVAATHAVRRLREVGTEKGIIELSSRYVEGPLITGTVLSAVAASALDAPAFYSAPCGDGLHAFLLVTDEEARERISPEEGDFDTIRETLTATASSHGGLVRAKAVARFLRRLGFELTGESTGAAITAVSSAGRALRAEFGGNGVLCAVETVVPQ